MTTASALDTTTQYVYSGVAVSAMASEERSVRILLVDDNAAKRLALKVALAPLGYTVIEAESGLTALRCIMSQDFAVILLDVCMPTMDGFETASLIRQRRQSEMTPIIFITAFSSDEITDRDRYSQGAVDFMLAPVKPDELRAKVSVFANLFVRAEALASRAREVQASADRLRLLTDAAPIGIFQTDNRNRYLYTNPRWSEIMGIRAEDAAGRDWDIVIDSEQRAIFMAELTESGTYRTEFSQRFEIRGHGTSSRIVLMTSVPVPDTQGGAAGWVGTVADVTAEAGAEIATAEARDAANEASQLKSDFLANMSHEIRTPMNGVIGLTELLLETDLDARQLDYARSVKSSGEALVNIINDILDFSKVEAGKLEMADIEFQLDVVIKGVVDLFAGSAQTKGLEFVVVVESSIPTTLRGDPGRLRQVLTNLIGNAIKFTHDGEIVLRVTRSEASGTDTIIRFEISDTGDGIPSDRIDAVFQPFVQVDTSTSRKYGGTGLGLAISAQLVTLMEGHCGVSSRLGEGSIFWFTICLHGVEREALGFPTSYPDLAGVRALIVDDSATQCLALSDYLTTWGMTVTTCDSGETALATLQAAVVKDEPYAVVLIDQFMPCMSGLELIASIVDDPELAPRMVLMIGVHQEYDLRELIRSRVCGTLSKPVHRKELVRSIRAALGVQDVLVDPIDTASPSRALPGSGHAFGRILLAEDNLINQKVAVAMLSGAGYRVDTVLDGESALHAVAGQHYDAVLMDCQMPGLDGYQATAAIRVHEGVGRHVPIIAMTAGARREDKERCLSAGMDGYLSKPVSRDALVAMVGTFLKDTQSSGGEEVPHADQVPEAEIALDPLPFDEVRLPTNGAVDMEQVETDYEDLLSTLTQKESPPSLENSRNHGRLALASEPMPMSSS
jgi:two-component system, sensor histidine kinase and response regulator